MSAVFDTGRSSLYPDRARVKEFAVPRWLSSLLIAAGFFALVCLAFLPRNLEVAVIITDYSSTTRGAPAPIAEPHR